MLLSFDVFGTLINVRESSYDAFRSILGEYGRSDVDVRAFWEYWEERNIAHYWEAYRPYKDICALSLGEAFARFDVAHYLVRLGPYRDGDHKTEGVVVTETKYGVVDQVVKHFEALQKRS